METLAVKKKAKGKGPSPGQAPVVVGIKGTRAWKEWLEKAADHCRMSVSGLIDKAVSEYAKKEGFDEPPPKR